MNRLDAPAREEALLAEADALAIPWQAILLDEIVAEKTLQRGFPESPAEWPLACAFHLLPSSLLRSWRVRDRLARLSWEATAEGSREAAMQLRDLYRHMTGSRISRPPIDFLMASHLWLGYRRVLELRNAARAADRSRGSRASRIEAVLRTGCSASDAGWAIDRADRTRKSHTLDDAMRQTRTEGFELPHGRSEPDAFLRLKRFLLRRGFLPARSGRPSARTRHFVAGDEHLAGPPGKKSRPRRIPGNLPSDPEDFTAGRIGP